MSDIFHIWSLKSHYLRYKLERKRHRAQYYEKSDIISYFVTYNTRIKTDIRDIFAFVTFKK